MSTFKSYRLDELAEVVTGETPRSEHPDSWGDEVDFITPSDQSNGMRRVSCERKLSRVGAERHKRRIVPPGSTNLTCIGATIGKVSQAANFCLTNQQINSLVARPDVCDPDYLYYLIRDWSYRLKQDAVGSATPIVNKSTLASYSFVVPGLQTQRAIAEVLGALDDKISANRQVMETASELQQAIWARSTRDVTRVALAEVADIHLGGTPPRGDASAWDGNVAWASVRDMSAAPGGVILETSEHISRASADRVRRLTDLPPGSTFISARGTVGLVTTNAIPCAINQSAYALLARDVSPVGLRLAVAELGDYLRARAHGSVFDTITTETLNESLIPDLRDPSVRAIELSIENLEALRIARARENQVLASTRDELLPLLMSGRITVGAASSHVEVVV